MQPISISGPSGNLFTLLHPPATGVEVQGWVLHVPAFGEEMNKSRPMVQQCANKLAKQGFIVVRPDLYGTGDSAGEFVDANWQIWQDDLEYIIVWMQSCGARDLILWGLRLGCLMATQLVFSSAIPVRQLLLWHPAHDGHQIMNQFLRLRVASSMMSDKPETVKSLRAELNKTGSVQVAGYQLSKALYTQITEQNLRTLVPPESVNVDWFELVSNEETPFNQAGQAIVSKWQEQAVTLRAHRVVGTQFWTTQEVSYAPNLTEATVARIESQPYHTGGVAWSIVDDYIRKDRVRASHSTERGVMFPCMGDNLVGVYHGVADQVSKGVVLIVGGPQYRVGSHRQFVQLARSLAANGTPVLRFDYRGMGDSEGVFRGFEFIHDDIAAAIGQLQILNSGIDEVVLMGLCDAATAASFYAQSDERVKGLVMLNPWVQSEDGKARALLKYYYLERIFSRNFWRKILSGEFKFTASATSFRKNLALAFGRRGQEDPDTRDTDVKATGTTQRLCLQMEDALAKYRGKLLLVLSGRDLTAIEFKESINRSPRMQKILSSTSVEKCEIPDADHTFSIKESKQKLTDIVIQWLQLP